MVENTDEFFHYFAIWCAFSGVLLISPALVRDALHRTRAMQWTSRRGRRVLNVQMGAALLSGLLLTLLNCARLPGAISIHRSDEVLELSHGQRVEGELPLV